MGIIKEYFSKHLEMGENVRGRGVPTPAPIKF